MNLKLPRLGLSGEYQFTVFNADRSVKSVSNWVKNLITDIGMDRIGTGSSMGIYCRIGTGTTAPANADTQLVSQSASASTTVGSPSSVNAGTPNYESIFTITYEFALGAVVGNMAEVGIGWSSSGATLFSRALILDGGGSPTTITVLVTEILQVTYRFTMWPVLTDVTSTVTISGVVYAYTARTRSIATALAGNVFGSLLNSAAATAYNGAIGAITAVPAGTSAALTVSALASYTNGTYYRDCTLSAAIGSVNLAGGIRCITFDGQGGGSANNFRTQMEFTPVIPKDNTKVLSLTMRQPWSRH